MRKNVLRNIQQLELDPEGNVRKTEENTHDNWYPKKSRQTTNWKRSDDRHCWQKERKISFVADTKGI